MHFLDSIGTHHVSSVVPELNQEHTTRFEELSMYLCRLLLVHDFRNSIYLTFQDVRFSILQARDEY